MKLKKILLEVDGEEKAVRLGSSSTLLDILKKVGLSQETAIVTVNNKVTIARKKIPNGKIKVYKVVSGG